MTLLQDLRYAVRMLLKDPWFTAVAAVALGLGIGVNTTVFTFVNAVLIRGLPFDRPDEIVLLATRNTTGDADNSSPASWQEFEDWRAKSRSFSGLAGVPATAVQRQRPGPPGRARQRRRGHGQHVRAARQQPFLGRDFAPGEDAAGAAPVVIIGHSVWKNRYDSDPASSAARSKINEVAYAIIGVMPERMRFPTNADMWRPLQPPAPETRRTSRQQRRLRPPGDRRHLEPGGDRDGRRSRASCKPPTPSSNKNIEARADDVQRTLQRRADPADFPVAARGGRLRPADRLCERRQPAARALGVPRARDGRAHRARRQPRTHRPPAAHRERHARVSRRPARVEPHRGRRQAVRRRRRRRRQALLDRLYPRPLGVRLLRCRSASPPASSSASRRRCRSRRPTSTI